MAKRDFYETLGVSKTATDPELKSAFRKAAMQCHPDRHPGDQQAEARFKELNEAYQHLSDTQKRAAYDRYGHAAFDQSGMSDGFASSMSDIFDDLFGDMMGGGGRRGRQPSGRERGADLRYNLEITLEEAFHGKTAAIRMPTSVACEACSGSGDLQDLRRTRARARATGLLRHRAHLSHLSWPRADDRKPLRQMRRRRPRHPGADAVGQRSRWR
jgi:molecular chaperone DnaJ